VLLTATIVLIFAFVVLLVLGLNTPREPDALQDRIRRIARGDGGDDAAPSLADAHLAAPMTERLIQPLLRRLASLADRFLPGKSSEATELALRRAGNPLGLGVAEFNGLRVLSIGIGIVIGLCAWRYLDQTPPMRAGAFGLCLLFWLTLPDTLLQRKITQRQTIIRKSLPETIDLLVVSVEAGMGFDGAVSKVVAKMQGPLSQELEYALHEMRLGKSRMQALKDMAARIGLPELTTFVAAVYQADQLGVSIARVLHVQSHTIRTARVQRIREIAATLPVKMLFPLVFFIFPAIFVVMLGPGIIRILKAF
jgi:tight adherence protein C